MNKKTTFFIILGLSLGAVLIMAVIMGLPGQFLQGALYNIRPIYSECRIEGKNYNSNKLEDCEQFQQKFQKGFFPDGEYTIFTKYVSKALPENITPLKIAGNQLSCNYIDNGYTPNFTAIDPKNTLSGQNLQNNAEMPIGSNGLILQLNYLKNGQKYFYDTNICESAFQANISDHQKQALGTAKLDYNGFINSRPLVNEILITDKPYFSSADGQSSRAFQPGNIFFNLNSAPEINFKMTIPCSANLPEVKIDNLETDKDTNLSLEGLTPYFLETCGGRLYFSFQNTNRYDDIQTIQNINLNSTDSGAIYPLKLSELNRVTDNQTVFPISFKVNLHLRERSDSNEVFTLGSGLLTVTNYNPDQKKPKVKTQQNDANNSSGNYSDQPTITDQQASPDQQTITEKIAPAPVSDPIPDPNPEPDQLNTETVETEPAKVRHSPEAILVNPEIPGAAIEEETQQ